MSASSAMASGCPRPSRTSCGPGGRRYPGALEQLAALRLVEVAEAMHPDHRAPAGIAAPGRGGGLAAGQHDHAVGRQRGQERLAQPAVDGAELLVAVDQQDAAIGQHARRLAGRGRHRVLESLGRGIDLTGVEQQDGPARVPRPGAAFQQQGGLADAARWWLGPVWLCCGHERRARVLFGRPSALFRMAR
jgi:hypothetical protein